MSEQDKVPEPDAKGELLYQAWTVIANAGGGDWDREAPEWKEAAIRWRDQWHALLDQERASK